MSSVDYFLAAYDAQLRTDAETAGATRVAALGPLRLVTFAGGRGFITYADLAGADASVIRGWVGAALAYFQSDPAIARVEWKTRGHDHAPELHDALLQHGFVPDEPESIMIGEAALLAVDVALPPGVTLRRVSSEADVRATRMQLWVAEVAGTIVSTGRLEPVAGTDFAGLWGGATLPAWRHRGIYRALTAARARAALDLGKILLHSDSTEFSRPILERAGLIRVSTTTPYEWRR